MEDLEKDTENWTVHLMDTGQQTQTGGRIKRLEPWLKDATFMATYGDGVCDVDIRKVCWNFTNHTAKLPRSPLFAPGPLRRPGV